MVMVKSENNPADHSSKGLHVTQSLSSNWITGHEKIGESGFLIIDEARQCLHRLMGLLYALDSEVKV
jgi:hypothetical protein